MVTDSDAISMMISRSSHAFPKTVMAKLPLQDLATISGLVHGTCKSSQVFTLSTLDTRHGTYHQNSRPSLSATQPIYASSHLHPPPTPLSFAATPNPSAQTTPGDITCEVCSEKETQQE